MPSEVTLDRLFRPNVPFEIGGQKFTIRALSDPEQNGRSMYATNRGRKIEKELADPQSDIYQYRIFVLERMSVESLQALLRGNRAGEIRRDLERDKPPVYIPFPDEATEEEKRAVLDSREESEAKRVKDINDAVEVKSSEFFDKFLKDKAQAELFGMAKAQIIETLVLEQANMTFAHYTLYCAVMKDGEQFFASPDEVAQMKDEVIFKMYRVAHEVNGIDPLALNGSSSTAA